MTRRVDEASRVVHADAARVFHALVEVAALERWLPPAGMSGRAELLADAPNGGYRMELTYSEVAAGHGKTSSTSDVSEVRFVEVVEGERLVQPSTSSAGTRRSGGP